MESSAIIKLEAVTVSQKVLDQIGYHDWNPEMERWVLGWYVDRRGTGVIARNLEGRYFKCYVSRPTEIKDRFPQIFIK